MQYRLFEWHPVTYFKVMSYVVYNVRFRCIGFRFEVCAVAAERAPYIHYFVLDAKKKKNCCCSTAFFSVFSSVFGNRRDDLMIVFSTDNFFARKFIGFCELSSAVWFPNNSWKVPVFGIFTWRYSWIVSTNKCARR